MFWIPIVKDTKGKSENNRILHVKKIKANIKREYNVEIELVINEKFQKCLWELRDYAKNETKALQCPLLRLMQIEEYVNDYVAKLTNRGN